MGLLDSLFQPSNYAGNGGLLDRLLPMLGNYQSPGFPQQDTFNDRWNALPGGSGRSFDNALFNPATFAPSQPPSQPNNPVAVGNYQMPRVGNPDQFQPQQALTPPNAQPTQGQLPQQAPQQAPQPSPQAQQPLPPALGGNSFGGNLGAGLQNFVNAGGPLQALAGGLTGLFTGQRTDPQGMAQQDRLAQYQATRQALIANGVPERQANSTAMLAAINPEAARTVLPELLTSKVDYKTEKDALGAEHGYWIDKINQTKTPAEAPNSNSSSGGVSLLAPGVQQYNPNLSGDEYLNQFGPEVKAAVKAYINGDVMPTGNPRTQAIATKAKEIALKYGQDMGIPVSDTIYAEKRRYRTELGSNSANAAGGQAKAFNQGISHLSDLADKLEKLDNSNGFGIPFVANTVNAARQGMSIDQAAISDEAKSIGQTVAGEVGKLFSGQAGGGVHERELTRERFDTVKSKPQLAGALRATIETMQGGLSALEKNRDRILGQNSGVDFVSDETRQKIAKIQGVIDRLEGKGGQATPSAPGALPSGWSVQVR